jgi:acyl-CoA thioester hydrolase
VTVFELPIRVYYEDTDAGGVVYYANYLRFLERARTECLRSTGFEQERLAREDGVLFAVRRVEIDYLRPARLDDALVVESTIERFARASMLFRQTVRRGADDRLAEALVKVVCLDSEGFRPAAIPNHVREKLQNAQ